MKQLFDRCKNLLLAIVATVLFSLPLAAPASALQPFQDVCKSSDAASQSTLCRGSSDALFGPNSIWTRIINILLVVIGMISVLMIVVGGIRYTVSAGDPKAVTDAKNTILYAVVGLIVAVLAGAIVNFVLGRL